MINALQLYSDISSRDRQLAGQDQDRDIRNNLMRYELAFKQDAANREREKMNMLAQQMNQRFALGRAGMQSKERLAQQRMNQPIWDQSRGVFVNRPMSGLGGGVIRPEGLPDINNKPPSGYRTTREGTLEAIPGGPADAKQAGAFNQDVAQLQFTQSGLDRLATAANEVLQSPGLGRITGIAGMIPNVPGMAGADAQAKLQTLKAQVGFNVLQEMRNASKTGGALGSITERELGFLQNALNALDTAQSEGQIRESLSNIMKYANDAKGRLQGAFNLKHEKRAAQQGGASTPAENDPLGLRPRK